MKSHGRVIIFFITKSGERCACLAAVNKYRLQRKMERTFVNDARQKVTIFFINLVIEIYRVNDR